MKYSRIAALALAGALALPLAACGSGSDQSGAAAGSGGASGGNQVTIHVAGLLPTADDAAKQQLKERIDSFQQKYPNITVIADDYEWRATTFTTELAGGTLPNVFEIPLTDGKTLIQNGQLADIDALVRALPYGDQFNQNLLANGQDADGTIYAVPAKSVYAVTLHYNRNLFEQAGLDPDKPPTTWDEVREDSKVIHEKTGKAGYAMMALDNAGGWMLVAAANSRGGTIQDFDGTTYTAHLDAPQVKDKLEWLHDLKWEDGSLYDRTDLGWGEINQEFAAGNFAMYTSGSDIYNSLVEANGVTADWGYGMTAIPTEGADGGALTGGTMAAVSKESTDEQKDAAVKWIDWWYLSKLQDKDQAIADAKTRAEADPPQAVGTPVLPIFDQSLYEENLEWIHDFINVPLDDMKGYTDVMFTQKLIPEASASVQDQYAQLFPVVQAVISDKDADIDQLLANANKAGQQILDTAE